MHCKPEAILPTKITKKYQEPTLVGFHKCGTVPQSKAHHSRHHHSCLRQAKHKKASLGSLASTF